MKKKYIIIGISLLIIINIVALITISYNKYCRFKDTCLLKENRSGENFICRQLSLSDSQIVKLHSLNMQFKHHIRSVNASLHKKRIKLIELLSNTDPDRNEIDNVLHEISLIQSKLQKDAVLNILKEMENLTPLQKTEYIKIISELILHNKGLDEISKNNFSQDSCEINCQPVDKKINIKEVKNK